MSVDTERIRESVSYSHRMVLQTPLLILATLGAFLFVVGLEAGVVGLAVLCVTVPMTTLVRSLDSLFFYI
jgi:hypothetical protein